MAKTSILLKMGLDTSKMKVALDQTKKDINTFSTSAISKLGGIAKIASGALVTGFIASAKSALQYGKELDNLANLSGATFDEFQRLTLGAKTVGIENQKLGDIFKDNIFRNIEATSFINLLEHACSHFAILTHEIKYKTLKITKHNFNVFI